MNHVSHISIQLFKSIILNLYDLYDKKFRENRAVSPAQFSIQTKNSVIISSVFHTQIQGNLFLRHRLLMIKSEVYKYFLPHLSRHKNGRL